jgi:hypothetical protein
VIDAILVASAAFCLTLGLFPYLCDLVRHLLVNHIVKTEIANLDSEIRDVFG